MNFQQERANGQPGWRWAVVGVFIAWIFFSLGAYYVAQKPLDSAMLAVIGQQIGTWSEISLSATAVWRSFLDVLTAVYLLMIALGLGLWLWRWLGPADGRMAEAALLSVGLGFGALALIVLLVGLVGWLTRPFLLGLSLLLAAAGLPVLLPFFRTIRLPKRPSPLITLYLVVVVGLALSVALLPPTSWDSLSYHLRGPWLYLQAGRIYPGVDVFSLNNPFLLEMLFMLSMALRSDSSAQLVHFFFLFLLGGQVYLLAVHGLRLKDGWTAVLLLFTVPMVWQLAAFTYNDLALAFTILATLYAYVRWREGGQSSWLLLSGLFSGLAMSLKYTSFVAPMLIGLLLIAGNWRQPRRLVRLLLLFAAPALVVALPWYIKNWAFTGNPVYPFVWHGRFWDEFRANAHQNPGSGIGWNLWAILTVPYTLTLGIADASGDGLIGPLFLALLPLLLLYGLSRYGRRAPFAFRLLLLYALAHYAVWLLGVIGSAPLWQGRLMLPALAALCPVLAWILSDLSRFDHPQFSLQRFLNLLLALVLLFGLVGQVGDWLRQNPLAYDVGSQTRAEYLTRTLGYVYLASAEMSQTLPPDAVVQFLWEPRTYYCQLDCRGDHILDKYTHLEFLHGDADHIAQALRDEGVTHLFIHNAGLNFLREAQESWVIPADDAEYERFLAQHTRLVRQWGEAYMLLELAP